MSWTSRPENVACCASEYGPVQNDEQLVRLSLKDVPCQGYNDFDRTHFFPPTDRVFSNQCGIQDGASNDRRINISDTEIRRRCSDFAASMTAKQTSKGKHKIFEPNGAHVGLIWNIRSVRRTSKPDEQVVFIYDDPLAGNQQHAVVRVSESVPEVERRNIIQKIKRQFELGVSQQ